MPPWLDTTTSYVNYTFTVYFAIEVRNWLHPCLWIFIDCTPCAVPRPPGASAVCMLELIHALICRMWPCRSPSASLV
jgi:hypothetical protein